MIKDYTGCYIQVMVQATQNQFVFYTGKVKQQAPLSLILEPFASDDSWLDWSKLGATAKEAVLMYKVQFEVEIFTKNIITISLLPKSGGYL